MKLKLFCGSLFACLVINGHAGSYVTNFDGLIDGQDLAGQDGWQIIGASSSNGPSLVTDSFLGGLQGQGGAFGFQEITGTTSYLYRNYDELLVGNPAGYTSFYVSFRVQDSTTTYPNRDTFGFAFRGTSGEDILTVRMAPTTQSTQPQNPLNPTNNRENRFSWSSDYSVLDQSNIGTLFEYDPNPPNLNLYSDISVLFTPSGVNDVAFSVVIGGNPAASGVLTGIGAAELDTYGFLWEPLDPFDVGANQLLFDNLAIVPEPSSTLLLGIAGLGLALRRRRA